MPQLLLELFSEEIPARMQAQAARDLERMARERLAEAGLLPSALKTFAGPRRLTLVAEDLPAAQGDRTEERKGPRVGAPDQAIEGFLRSTGLTRDQLTERDGVYFAVIARAGRPTADIIAEMVEAIVRNFPWPKSMTWGEGTLRWVRPLQRILCVFDGEVAPVTIGGIAAGDLTEGHRFMGSRQPIRARNFDDYEAGLRSNFVLLDADERKARIMDGARTLCFARNLELVEDEGLLDEVAGLAEWPTPLLGDMDPAFLDLPPEVIRTSMRTHQKYFAVRKPGQDGLAPHFLVVANIEATDGGAAVAAGNARVLSARLNDARFFWDEDRKIPLEDRLEKLKAVTFHAKLGTMYERVERIEALAREIAPLFDVEPDLAGMAARLSKADLVTSMVGEFPELQGLMGGYYALTEGLDPSVAEAITDHYRPLGPGDEVPRSPLAASVAFADKLDTLAGFFLVDERPTGSKDPYALRRAGLGILRIIEEHAVPVELRGNDLIFNHLKRFSSGKTLSYIEVAPVLDQITFSFLRDRLEVLLRDRGFDALIVRAALEGRTLSGFKPIDLIRSVEALEYFLKSDDGRNLLAGYRRATSLLNSEERKAPLPTGQATIRPESGPEEKTLLAALTTIQPQLEAHLQAENFVLAMSALASLRAPVDAFFDKVLVNTDDNAVRENRLRLLSQVRDAMHRVADFSLISG